MSQPTEQREAKGSKRNGEDTALIIGPGRGLGKALSARKNTQGMVIGLSRASQASAFAEWLMAEGIDSLSLNPDTVVATWQRLGAALRVHQPRGEAGGELVRVTDPVHAREGVVAEQRDEVEVLGRRVVVGQQGLVAVRGVHIEGARLEGLHQLAHLAAGAADAQHVGTPGQGQQRRGRHHARQNATQPRGACRRGGKNQALTGLRAGAGGLEASGSTLIGHQGGDFNLHLGLLFHQT